MDPEVTIFSSVFRSILESFSPSLIQIISEYERRSLLGSKVSDNIIMLFKHLPRGLPTYVKILEDLTSVSTSNPPKILHFLCKLIKNTITGKTTGIMPLSSPAFNAGNHEHQLIYYYFSLFLLSDLIYRISINADVYMASGPIISTGYFIASKLHNINEVDNIIVNQWAVIFSITSEFSCSDITDLFGDFDDPERGFRIIQYSRLDYNKDNAIKFFNDTIIPEMIKLYKKKSLTSSIFRSISSLLLCIPCNEDIYSKIFEIAYHKKFINEDNEGSIILCLMILQRHPRKKNMLEHFAQKRIFSKSVTPEKLLFSLWGFRVFMFGKNLDPSWYFWEWGNDEKIDRLCYLKWNSMIELQTDSHYFKNLFMTHYFHSLNYNLNHEQISQLTSIIAHIASMDLSLFISDIIPSFLKLRENDSRLIAFVSALSIINSNSFKQFSSCTINNTILTKLNSSIRPKLLQIFLNYNSIEVESLDLENSQKHTDHVPYEMHELITLSQLRESDKKILEILEHLHIHYYIKLSNMLSPSEYIDNDLSIYSYLIETLNDLFTDEDFETPDILRTLIKMSINKNRKLSNIAYLLCKEILSTQINNLMAIETILSCVKRNISSEHLYVTMSLLLYGLTFSDISKIPYHLLMEIEINAFYGLCTEFPLLRNILYLVLKKLNHALHNNGIIHYIQSNLEEIEKNVKIRVMSHQESNNAADFVLHELSHEISNKSDSFYKLSQNIYYNLNSNQKNKVFSNMPVSEVNIKLEICLSSHYYDIWLHFIKEILNLMIEINYTPILEKIAENREELIHFLVDQTNISSLGMIMTYTSSLYQLSLLKKFKKLDKEPFSEYDSQKSGKLLFHIRRFVKKLANSNDDRKNDISLFIIKNSHFSILPRLLTVLAKAPINIYEKVIETTLFILKSPEITQEFIKTYIKKFIMIMSNSQYTIQNWKLNETRFINWSDESEQSIIKHRNMLSNFCNICYMILINGPSHFSDSIFPYEIRYVTARFFYNWTQTKSDMLSNLRFVSKRSLSSLIKIGPIFGGNMKFDECPIKLFGEMESEGFQILNVLLQNHYNVLIKQFISTIYSQPYPIAKLFFNAIIENLNIDNAEKSSLVSGQLILLGLVTSQIKLPNYYIGCPVM